MNATPVRVGIAIVRDRDRYLVGVRGADGPLPGRSEFPGGKCRPGESHQQAAIRECREESGLDVQALELLDQRQFDYPHATVDLQFWLCELRPEANAATPANGFRWVEPAQLSALPFPEANQPVVELLLAKARSGQPA